jgi:putative redox protein
MVGIYIQNGADLLPLSLIGCAAWDIVKILQKQRQHVTQFKFYADSERDDQPPWRFRKIRVHYQITGQNLKEESIKRAIELSETKYCSIFATLRDIVEIQTEYEVVQA